jgi:Putative lumazine-binding
VGSDEETVMALSTTPQTDQAAIVATVLDYFEGWFDGDVTRMRRALHPRLAKRASKEHGATLNETTAAEMINATEKQLGRERDVPERGIEVDVVDVYRDIATVVVRSAVYHEYVHLVRTGEGWKIVNALWAWS